MLLLLVCSVSVLASPAPGRAEFKGSHVQNLVNWNFATWNPSLLSISPACAKRFMEQLESCIPKPPEQDCEHWRRFWCALDIKKAPECASEKDQAFLEDHFRRVEEILRKNHGDPEKCKENTQNPVSNWNLHSLAAWNADPPVSPACVKRYYEQRDTCTPKPFNESCDYWRHHWCMQDIKKAPECASEQDQAFLENAFLVDEEWLRKHHGDPEKCKKNPQNPQNPLNLLSFDDLQDSDEISPECGASFEKHILKCTEKPAEVPCDMWRQFWCFAKVKSAPECASKSDQAFLAQWFVKEEAKLRELFGDPEKCKDSALQLFRNRAYRASGLWNVKSNKFSPECKKRLHEYYIKCTKKPAVENCDWWRQLWCGAEFGQTAECANQKDQAAFKEWYAKHDELFRKIYGDPEKCKY